MCSNGENLSSKGVIFLKLLFLNFLDFSGFIEFILSFISLKKCKKGVFLSPQNPGADVAQSWHSVQDPSGCDMARKATWQSRASPRGAQVARVTRTHGRATRVHTDARGTPRGMRGGGGGWHVEDPRVSGPWLNSWDSNARTLFHPTLYTPQAPRFSPCGTMSHLIF